MDAAIAQLQAEDSQDRIAAVKKLQTLLEQNKKGLSATEVGTLLNATVDLLKDNDHEVCQGALHVLASAASLAGERLQLDFMTLLPAIVDRLGDEKQSVRDAGRGLLLALMQIFSPTVVLERVSSHVSRHESWKAREEFVRVLTSAIRLFPENELPILQVLLPVVLDLLEDTNPHVRESTMAFLEKMYQQKGIPFRDELQCCCLRPGQLREINSRLEKVDTKVCTCGPKTSTPSSVGNRKQVKATVPAGGGPGSYREKHASAAVARLGVDSPSARDPPQPASPSVQVDVHLNGNDHGTDEVSMTIDEPIRSAEDEPKQLYQSCCNALKDDEEVCCIPGMISLDETLAESLSKNADWSVRVGAFTYIKKLLQQGPRGLHEIHQCFESIMKLLQDHVTDAHYKVAQAALSVLVELVKACRKAFGSYVELLLPLLFPRLVDAREETSELAASALQTIGNSYDIKILFPALIRSLDEQRSPKGKIAVIEYAIGAFVKLEFNYETISPLLRIWLTKLVSLAKSRNAKLKETALMGIIAVYSHLDTIMVLEFILSLTVEEQTSLRRALKQYVPQIEVDVIYHLRYRSHRVPHVKLDENEISAALKKPYMHVFPMIKSCEKRPPNTHEIDRSGVHEAMVRELQYNCRTTNNFGDPLSVAHKIRDYNTGWEPNADRTRRWLEGYATQNLEVNASDGTQGVANIQQQDNETSREMALLIQQMSSWSPDKPAAQKHEALLAAVQLFQSSDSKVWPQYFDKLVGTVLEAAKDHDQCTRELALSIIPDLLSQIVSRLPQSMLTAKLATFLPALLDAFGHQDEDVRKAVLFCLVDIYVVLGKAFLPYLSSLNAMQLQLVTTYASRMSQAEPL